MNLKTFSFVLSLTRNPLSDYNNSGREKNNINNRVYVDAVFAVVSQYEKNIDERREGAYEGWCCV